jgi:hypothetical protein
VSHSDDDFNEKITIEDWKKAIAYSETVTKYHWLNSLLEHWGMKNLTIDMVVDAQTRLNKIDHTWSIDFERHSIEIHHEGHDDWGPITSITEIESIESLIDVFEEFEEYEKAKRASLKEERSKNG